MGFDDMMALVGMHHNLKHIIAVDRKFELFSRAWCVAELARGHNLGLRQYLKIPSFEVFEANRPALQELDIRSMRASRAEDVLEILSKIPDVIAFNSHLKSI